MNVSKKQVVSTIMLGLMVTPLSGALAQPVQSVQSSAMGSISNEVMKSLAQDTYILDGKMVDVTGDNSKDGIYLIGHKASEEAIYADHLTLLVEDGVTKELITAELDKFGGYEGKLFVGDFSGDRVADVMVSAATGGSGGMVDHRILSFNGGQSSVIFNQDNNRGLQFTGKFINGFQARVTDYEYGISTMIDLQGKKDLYVESKIYNTDGMVLKDVKPISYPLASLEPVDYDHNGVYELKGIQRIIGAYGADGIGNIYSTWKYENNQWVAENIEVSSFLSHFHPVSSIARPSAKTIVLTELDHNKEITVESGDQIQIKLQQSSGTGYQWLLDSFDTAGIELVSETTEKMGNSDKLVGGPYTKVFNLKTKKMGKVDIKLYNVRSWESKEKAASSFSITINNLPKGL